MRISELRNGRSGSDKVKMCQEFADWAIRKLGISGQPKIKYSNDSSKVHSRRTFGSTHPTGEIWVHVGNRNTADIMRTLCHELVHYRQFEIGTASEEMSEDQRQHIEDEANAIAGRMMRDYGKMHVKIYEGRTGSLQHEVADSLPQAFVIPGLSASDNPYLQYKFGTAIAGIRGRHARKYDDIPDFKLSALDDVFRDQEVVISYDPDIGEIIDQALKEIGVKGGKRRIGVEGSKESSDVQSVSPLKPFKGYGR